MDDMISAIIPVYNTAMYIEKCIRSIMDQTYTNMQIICVDDGSTDGSLEIMQELSKEDARVEIISGDHKNAGAARNKGIYAAKGEYICFIDSDDYLEPDMFEVMQKKMKANNADIAICAFYIEKGNRQIVRINEESVPKTFDNRQLMRFAFERENHHAITVWPWNKMIRRGAMDGLINDETLFLGEDVDFFVNLFMRDIKGVFCEQHLYHHYIREASLSRKYLVRQFNDRLLAYERAIDKLEKAGYPADTVIWLKRFYVYHALNYVETAFECGDRANAELHKNDIRKFYREYVETNLDNPERLERAERLLNE